MSYNTLMSSHFKGCKLLLERTDQGRGRDQKVFHIGEDEVVGVSDGTDAWICAVHVFEKYDLRSIMRVEVKNRATTATQHSNRQSTHVGRPVLRATLDSGH